MTATAPALGSSAFFRNPYRTYRAILDAGTRALRLSPHIVAITHYRDCLDTLRDPRLSAKRYVRQLAHYTEEQQREISAWTGVSENMMFFMDAPEHTRVRKLLMNAFPRRPLAALLPRMRYLFRETCSTIYLPASRVDFMGRVAHRFPALVIGEILGVPREAGIG